MRGLEDVFCLDSFVYGMASKVPYDYDKGIQFNIHFFL